MSKAYERTVYGSDGYNSCDHGLTRLDWWKELNALLAEKGESEALFGDARYYYDSAYWPSTAACLIADERALSRARGE